MTVAPEAAAALPACHWRARVGSMAGKDVVSRVFDER
jgi:hypothetical protein